MDAGKAKELMASLVNLQSNIPEVNKYVCVILYPQYSLVKFAKSTGLFSTCELVVFVYSLLSLICLCYLFIQDCERRTL